MAFFRGSNRSDNVDGSDGRDLIFGKRGNDTIDGNGGNDYIDAGRGNDTVDGGSGHDIIFGGKGRDDITGGDGCDLVFGGSGSDTVDGGAGSDYVNAGRGRDTAVYTMAENAGSHDYYDGGRGHDTLVLNFTADEWAGAAVRADIEAYLEFLEDPGYAWYCFGWGYEQSFTFEAFGLTARDFEKLVVTVDGVEIDPNDNPVIASDDAVAIGEDDAVMAFASVLDNDTALDGVASVTVTTQPSSGMVVMDEATGTFTFDPAGAFEDLAEGETRDVTFDYVVTDTDGDTDTGTVTVTVTGANDAPTLTAATLSATEDGGVFTVDLAPFADDVDSDNTGADLSFAIPGVPSEGSAVFSGSVLEFDTGTAFQDLAAGETRDVIVNTSATDANLAVAVSQVVVTVTGTNDDPTVAAALVADASEDDPSFTLDLLAGASDVDNNSTLSVANVVGLGNGITVSGSTLAVDPSDDAFQDLAQGDTRDVVISYAIEDGAGGSVQQTATITITGSNDAPDLLSTTVEVSENDGLVEFDLTGLVNDIDSDGSIQTFSLEGRPPVEGAVEVTSGGLLRFDPINDFEDLGVGESRLVDVVITTTDAWNATDTEIVTVMVNGENDGPVAVDDMLETTESNAVSGDLLANDTDADANDTLVITGAGGVATGIEFSVTSAGGREGSALVSASGAVNFTFAPGDGFENLSAGETDTVSITYDISDGNGGTSNATATVTIVGENDGPSAEDDAFTTSDTGQFTGDLLANDTDPDASDTLVISGANGIAAGTSFAVTSAAGREGTVSVSPSGATNFVFDPLGNFADMQLGETDTVSFTYDISDGNGGTSSAEATLTILGDGPGVAAESVTFLTANTGQEVSVSFSTVSATSDGTVDAEIDINFGAVIQPEINVVYVVDTSGSTIASVLDQEKAALQALTQQIGNAGYADGAVTISIVPFSTTTSPDATGDGVSQFVLDTTDDSGTTDIAAINAAIANLNGGGFTNYTGALDIATDVLLDLDPTGSETNVVYFLSDGQPTIRTAAGAITTQTVAEIAAAAAPLHSFAEVSAFEIGNVNALEFLDALDNTGGTTQVNSPTDLSSALLGSPIPEGTVVQADVFVFDDSDVPGTLIETINIDVPGGLDDPANPDLIETPLGLELDLSISNLAFDLGDQSRLELVVQLDDNEDGIADDTVSIGLDIFGLA